MLPTGWVFFPVSIICTFMDIVLDDGYKGETSDFECTKQKPTNVYIMLSCSAGCTSACWMAMCIPCSAGQKVLHHVSHESCNLRPIYSCHSCHFIVIVSYRR